MVLKYGMPLKLDIYLIIVDFWIIFSSRKHPAGKNVLLIHVARIVIQRIIGQSFIFNRPGVAGAVLQTPPSLSQSVIL